MSVTFELDAVVDTDGKVNAVRFSAIVPTPDIAQEVFSKLPKAFGFSATSIYETDCPITRGYVRTGWIRLSADNVNGGRNETGIKRIRRIMAALSYVYGNYFKNSATVEQLEEALK